jgi:hypothetical protein
MNGSFRGVDLHQALGSVRGSVAAVRSGGTLPVMATPRSTRDPLFLGRWLQDEVIIVAVRWYLTYPLSCRQVCEMLRDRGVLVSPSTVMRRVLRYASEFEKRWRRYSAGVVTRNR